MIKCGLIYVFEVVFFFDDELLISVFLGIKGLILNGNLKKKLIVWYILWFCLYVWVFLIDDFFEC